MSQHQAPAEPSAGSRRRKRANASAQGELKIVDVREHVGIRARPHSQREADPARARSSPDPQEAITSDNVVFVCEVGQRSAVAAEMAAALGMQHVFNLEGGMQAWRGAGLPTET